MFLVVLAATALLAGCSGEDGSPPVVLLDGSSPAEPSVVLEGIDDDIVVTSFEVVETDSLDPESKAGSCLEERYPELTADTTAVVRTGVSTESVTFRERGAGGVFGCSNAPGPRERGQWCSSSSGKLTAGRLTDPRLSIICQAPDGTSIGFAWVEPGDGTRFVAVEQPGYTEVYEVAGDLPVRIATVNGVDVETSSAQFEYSEHDAEGTRLREQTLEAFVAG